MRAWSTFSGVGGLDLGLARAGFEHDCFAESDAWRRGVLAAHWPGVAIHDDVRDVATKHERRSAASGLAAPPLGRDGSQPAADLLCGGFPCQDVSVAGQRRGLAGARSGLFHEFARIADAVRPVWLLVENVPGLLSSNDGRDFGVVLGTLAELGYGVAWRILDARYFGVPQRRRRVFIVGRLGGDAAPALRALCESCDGSPATSPCSWQGTPGGARSGAHIARSLNAGSRYDADTEDFIVSHALTAAGHDASEDGTGRGTPLVTAFHQTQDPISEVDASPVRRLTPVECERLMGWPDDWTAPPGVKAPDSRRYAACGDGVVANVSEWIGRRIVAVEWAS